MQGGAWYVRDEPTQVSTRVSTRVSQPRQLERTEKDPDQPDEAAQPDQPDEPAQPAQAGGVEFVIDEATFKDADGGWIQGKTRPLIDEVREWTRKAADVFRDHTRLRAQVDVKFDADVQTSNSMVDWDFHGNGEEKAIITFGRVRSYPVLYHEMAHIFLMRRIDAWLSRVGPATITNVFGEPEEATVYRSPRVDALIREFDGPDAYITVDKEWPNHYWPYMLSGKADYFEGAEIRCARLLQAFYDDLMEK